MILLDRIVIPYDGLLVIGGPYIIDVWSMFGLPEVHTHTNIFTHSHTLLESNT